MRRTTDHAMLKGLIWFLREVEEFRDVYIASILVDYGYADKDDLLRLGFDECDIESVMDGTL